MRCKKSDTSLPPGHGGNIYMLAEELRIPERRIIDFSASINPLGVSKKVKAEMRRHLKYLENYPDPDTKRLRKHLGRHHGIATGSILCGNGSTELIYLVAKALRPEKVLIPAPTFSEYEQACRISYESGVAACGSKKNDNINNELRIIRYNLKKENNYDIDTEEFINAMPECDMAFLCNPNSPTGRLIGKDDVLKIADAARGLGCLLIVDEAFMDFTPEDSVIREAGENPHLIVLRSMTKFYALSGLRLGYGVFPLNLLELIQRQREPWTVNTLAQRAGVVAIKDTAYKKETFGLMAREKRFMEDGFRRLGINYVPSPVNFYLIEPDNAEEITALLRKKGILVRGSSGFAGLEESYIRVAVKSRKDNSRLLRELGYLCKA